MINARMVYLRPGNLFQEFQVIRVETKLIGGSPVETKTITGSLVFGCLEEATPEEKARWDQPQHPVTHSIVQPGVPLAKPGWILQRDGRTYRVLGVDPCGDLGIATVYYAEERKDSGA